MNIDRNEVQRLSEAEMRAFVGNHKDDPCWPVPVNAPLQPESAFRYGKGGQLLPAAKSESRMAYQQRKHSRRLAESEFTERLYNPPPRNWPCG